MKKSSQWTLGASLVLFLTAGTVKFWPEERFLPTTASPFSPASFGSFGGGPPNGMPMPRSFAPGWAQPGGFVPRDNGGVGSGAMSKPTSSAALAAPAAPVMPGQHSRRTATTEEASANKGISPVSLSAQNTPVGEVLSHLFHQAGVSFAPTGQWDEPMTITFANAPMERALSQTLQLTTRPRLSWHVEKGVYIVTPVAMLPPPQQYPQYPNAPH